MAALQGRFEGVERWNREHARLSLELMDTVKPLAECLETRYEMRIAELSKEVESLREESRARMEKLEKFGYDLEKRLDTVRRRTRSPQIWSVERIQSVKRTRLVSTS